jgi:Prokaryotic cytochrome b561
LGDGGGLAAVILFEMANASARGDSIFSLFRVPRIYPNIPLPKPGLEKIHQTAANALVILAVAHALAAFAHHYILRDDVLRRMLPRRSIIYIYKSIVYKAPQPLMTAVAPGSVFDVANCAETTVGHLPT